MRKVGGRENGSVCCPKPRFSVELVETKIFPQAPCRSCNRLGYGLMDHVVLHCCTREWAQHIVSTDGGASHQAWNGRAHWLRRRKPPLLSALSPPSLDGHGGVRATAHSCSGREGGVDVGRRQAVTRTQEKEGDCLSRILAPCRSLLPLLSRSQRPPCALSCACARISACACLAGRWPWPCKSAAEAGVGWHVAQASRAQRGWPFLWWAGIVTWPGDQSPRSIHGPSSGPDISHGPPSLSHNVGLPPFFMPSSASPPSLAILRVSTPAGAAPFGCNGVPRYGCRPDGPFLAYFSLFPPLERQQQGWEPVQHSNSVPM